MQASALQSQQGQQVAFALPKTPKLRVLSFKASLGSLVVKKKAPIEADAAAEKADSAHSDLFSGCSSKS
jgi:hypothetical protein